VTTAGGGSPSPTRWNEVVFDAPLPQGGHLQGSLLFSDAGLRLSPLKLGTVFTLTLPDLPFRGPATVLSIQPAKRGGEREAEVQHVVRFRDDDDLGTVLLGDWEPPREFVERWRSRRREVALRLEHPDGGWCDAHLLRTVEWIAERGACVGGTIFLDLPEMGARGWAQVVAIQPCGMVEPGPGGLVTGRFRHSHGHPGELVLESDCVPIGVTSRHLFWSVDRGDWVPVGQLRRGERLKTLEGVTRVVSYTMSDRIEPVYNLEVEGDHCYRVGQHGILVHNASAPCCEFFSASDISAYPEMKHYHKLQSISGGRWNGKGRATKVEARINKSNRSGTKAARDPAGWYETANTQYQGPRIARTHVLARTLGGTGKDVRNLFTATQADNKREYDEIEKHIEERINKNETVDIIVEVVYETLGTPYPSAVNVFAISKDSTKSDGSCWTFAKLHRFDPTLGALNSLIGM
jgi:hypothetical protein